MAKKFIFAAIIALLVLGATLALRGAYRRSFIPAAPIITPTPDRSELIDYLNIHLSDLSPQKEVLGGHFYVTDLRLTSSSTAVVDYEDGHIAVSARFVYGYQDGQIRISDFHILPAPAPKKPQ